MSSKPKAHPADDLTFQSGTRGTSQPSEPSPPFPRSCTRAQKMWPEVAAILNLQKPWVCDPLVDVPGLLFLWAVAIFV